MKTDDLPILSGSSGTSAAPSAGPIGHGALRFGRPRAPVGREEMRAVPRCRCWLRQDLSAQQAWRASGSDSCRTEGSAPLPLPTLYGVRLFDGRCAARIAATSCAGHSRGAWPRSCTPTPTVWQADISICPAASHFQGKESSAPPEPDGQACGYFDPYSGRCMGPAEKQR